MHCRYINRKHYELAAWTGEFLYVVESRYFTVFRVESGTQWSSSGSLSLSLLSLFSQSLGNCEQQLPRHQNHLQWHFECLHLSELELWNLPPSSMDIPSLSSSDSNSLLNTAISMSRPILVSMRFWYSSSCLESSSRSLLISLSLAASWARWAEFVSSRFWVRSDIFWLRVRFEDSSSVTLVIRASILDLLSLRACSLEEALPLSSERDVWSSWT